MRPATSRRNVRLLLRFTAVLTAMVVLFSVLFHYIRCVSRSVMTGFVNALAILISIAQLPEFKGAGVLVYATVAAGLAIIYLLPRVTKAVPSPLGPRGSDDYGYQRHLFVGVAQKPAGASEDARASE